MGKRNNGALLLAAATLVAGAGVSSRARAITYQFFRYSPGDGRAWGQQDGPQVKCFVHADNSVYLMNWASLPECQSGWHWMVSPPTKHSNSSHQVFPWVQGTVSEYQGVCFQAWSYDQFGSTYAGSASVCPATGNFDANLTVNGIQVPAYGTFTIVGSFGGSTNQSTWSKWAAVAYNYNDTP